MAVLRSQSACTSAFPISVLNLSHYSLMKLRIQQLQRKLKQLRNAGLLWKVYVYFCGSFFLAVSGQKEKSCACEVLSLYFVACLAGQSATKRAGSFDT